MIKYTNKIFTWVDPEMIEKEAKQQLQNISKLPFIFQHISVMPDCHLGKGATVGSVIATKGAIIPAAVGVDIGCGMIAVRTSLKADQLPDDLGKLRSSIERSIPLGAGAKNHKMTKSAEKRATKLKKSSQDYYDKMTKWVEQLGSLGSGNHFIEICLDEDDIVWVVLHSGSRGIGNQIATHHIKIAQKLMDKYYINLIDNDLAYLIEGDQEFENYVRDMLWAQDFALLNRDEMMDRTMRELGYAIYGEEGHEAELEEDRINCHHNFTQLENHMGKNVWLTRKGAIQMREGQMGVIPGSMGTKSYIVEGKGNVPSFCSAPHGAGRRFSRTEARKRFDMKDFERELKGIEVRHSQQLLDEIPSAYKDIDEVIENSKELVTIKHKLHQVLNVKGD